MMREVIKVGGVRRSLACAARLPPTLSYVQKMRESLDSVQLCWDLHRLFDGGIVLVRHDHMCVIVLAGNRRRHVLLSPSFMHSSIDTYDIKLVVVLKNTYVFEGITINQNAIGIVPWFDLTQLVELHELCCDSGCGCDDSFVLCEAEKLHKMLEVPSIGSMRRPREAVVTSR
jgi:hypothetical protein